jgi:hypothetical protein
VNCQEIIELISAEVDGELDQDKKIRLHDHLRTCRNCLGTFELEKLTKLYIGRKLKRTASPAALKIGILQQLQPEPDPIHPRDTFLRRIVSIPKWQIMTTLAGSAAIIAIAFLLLPWRSDIPHNPPFNNNIIHQTFNNYHGILQGKIIPAVMTDNPAVAETYFVHNNQFPAYIPPMNNCKLLGAMYNKYTHEGIAHLVYKYDDHIIYIVEAALLDLTDKDGLVIPADVLAEVMKGEWYREDRIKDYSMIMWIHDATLCCAMTNISNQQLLACLTNK